MNLAYNETQQPNVLKSALSYARRGWHVIPLWWPLPGGRCACGSNRCKGPGKHPIIKNWTRQGSTDEAVIRQWWAKWPKANVGILTGERSGILLLDVDTKEDGPGQLAALEAIFDDLPNTIEAITGSGGRHILFKYPKGRVIPNKARFLPGLDTRSNGGMFVAPPSLHVSGRQYEWELSSHPEDIPLADVPEWLISLMENKHQTDTPTRVTAAPPADEYITEGARNSTLASLAGTMRRRGMTYDAILAALAAENLKRCSPPLDDDEIKTIAQSISKYPPGAEDFLTTKSFNLTDLGNAQRLVAKHGRDLRYCHAWGKWLIWDGRRWVKDSTGEVMRKAKDIARLIYGEAQAALDDEQRKAIAKHAMRSESESRLKAMVSLAESEPGIPVTTDQLDADPWLLNCKNGTIDLKTGLLREHKREDYITKMVSVAYDPGARCPTWEEFLNRIMDGNQALICFLKKAVGYTLTGDTSEQVLFFLFGTGANGKSTFLDTIGAMLADYAMQTPTETLMLKNKETVSNDIARLKGARFVAAVEAEEGRRLSEVLVKQLTGGDMITARFLHQEYFEFRPTFKIFLAANHKPVIKGTDNAIWRRLRMIPFTVTIPEPERDKKLLDKLRTELPGILRWAVEGCLEWQKEGLGTPDEVKAATDGYRAEMDVLSSFIDDCCIIRPYAKVGAGDIYGEYKKWCEVNGEKPVPQRNFGMRLTERGFERVRGTGGRYFWEGIGLIEQ